MPLVEDFPQFEVPPPGSALRSWSSAEPTRLRSEVELLLAMSDAQESFSRLLRGEKLDDGDVAAFGRLNYAAFVDMFVPVVGLWNKKVLLDPQIADLFRDEDVSAKDPVVDPG